jgi:hypothetical protein
MGPFVVNFVAVIVVVVVVIHGKRRGGGRRGQSVAAVVDCSFHGVGVGRKNE